MRFRLSRKAEDDLISIYVEGARRFSPSQAEIYHTGLLKTSSFLVQFPGAARERMEIEPPVRVHPCRAHIVVYRIDREGVFVLRIRHGRADWIATPGSPD